MTQMTQGEGKLDDLLETLLGHEERGWQALSEGSGGHHYRSALTDDALMVFPFGVLTRERAIAAMEAAPPWASFSLDETRVVRLTDDSAILTYRVIAQRTGDEPYVGFLTTVFVLHGGEWKSAFHQQSPVGS